MAARTRKLLAALALVAAIAPLFVALVAAHDDGWRPLGDDAVITVLTHDVFSTRTPELGMPTTLSASNDPHRSHHPGPLEFWSLAPFELGFGSAGMLLGVVIVNAAAIGLTAWALARVAGARTAATALALCALLAWAFGRQTVVDPWNPYIALFPMLALCALAWAAVAGHRYALWGVALVGSYVAQAHLLYVPLAAGLFATATLGLGESMWRRRKRGALAVRDVVVTAGGTVAALAIAWAFPIYDQLAHNPGNFTSIWRSVKDNPDPHIGLAYALRVMVRAIGAPPLFLHRTDSIGTVGLPWGRLGVVRIGTALLVLAALVVATVIAFRRRDRVSCAAGIVAGVALVITTGAIAELPTSFPNVPEYRLLQGWVIGAFAWLATGYVVTRAVVPYLDRIPRPTRRTLRIATLAPIIAVLAAAPIAIAFANSEGRDDIRLYPATERLETAIAARIPHKHQPYVLDIRGNQGLLGLDIGYGVLRGLLARGFDVGVPSYDYYLAGSHQAAAGAPHLVILTGRAAVEAARRNPGLLLTQFAIATSADHALLGRETDRLRSYFRDRSNLTAKGRDVLSTGTPVADAATLRGLFDGSLDPMKLLANDRLGVVWVHGLLRRDLFTSRAYDDYAAARQTVDDYVFAAYLEG